MTATMPGRDNNYFRVAMRKSRAKRINQACACSQKAFKLDSEGAPVCWRCNEIETHRFIWRENLHALAMIKPEAAKPVPAFERFFVSIRDTGHFIIIKAHGLYAYHL
jgi:hypothetical protein